MKLGCEDCGCVYARKRDVPRQCQPFTFYVTPNAECVGGYEWACVENPEWEVV